MAEVAHLHKAALKKKKVQKGSIERAVKNLSHGHSSAGTVSTRPGEQANDYQWGHVIGMSEYDSVWNHKFEDRRLNSTLYRIDRNANKPMPSLTSQLLSCFGKSSKTVEAQS